MHASELEPKHGDQKKRVGVTPHDADPLTILPSHHPTLSPSYPTGAIGKNRGQQVDGGCLPLDDSPHMYQMWGRRRLYEPLRE
jgi:hypothetical protein